MADEEVVDATGMAYGCLKLVLEPDGAAPWLRCFGARSTSKGRQLRFFSPVAMLIPLFSCEHSMHPEARLAAHGLTLQSAIPPSEHHVPFRTAGNLL